MHGYTLGLLQGLGEEILYAHHDICIQIPKLQKSAPKHSTKAGILRSVKDNIYKI
jgi:hypothetical protein